MGRRELIATATITYAELYAGITRNYRHGHLSQEQYERTCRQVEEEWPAYVLVELRDDVLQIARKLIQRHALRGFDAIHLASALSLKARLEEEFTFIASDERLLRTAAAEQLQTLNVEKASTP